MKFILGKKLEMTQIWDGDKVVAVTRVQAGPCLIVQVKQDEKDGYTAVQIGFGEKKEKNIKKPQSGHLKKLKSKNPDIKTNVRNLKEFRLSKEEIANLNIGDIVDVSTFVKGDIIKVTATSKGKGFQGVVKRHGFHGQNKTHGNKDQERMPGSIGAQATQRVLKGKRMGGHMGDERVTTSNMEIAGVELENNILLVKGAVPGARNGLVMIYGVGELVIKKPAAAEALAGKQKNKEDIKQEENTEKAEEVKEEVKN